MVDAQSDLKKPLMHTGTVRRRLFNGREGIDLAQLTAAVPLHQRIAET